MKHTILVQMLGNFRMEYDGKPLCAERMHRDGQFVRMMQAILYFAKKGISKDKLEEYVVGELEMGVPHTALRVMVYKTKKKLKELGVEGENLIYLKDGMYYWTDEIEVASDAAEFRKKYEQILEMQDELADLEENGVKLLTLLADDFTTEALVKLLHPRIAPELIS